MYFSRSKVGYFLNRPRTKNCMRCAHGLATGLASDEYGQNVVGPI